MKPGYRDTPLGARLRSGGARWGAFILSVDRTDSTNELALRYAREGAPHGSLVIAREQTGGRGRWNRHWESGPGGVYLSVILRPGPELRLTFLPFLVSVSVAESIIALTNLDVRLRWPNDLYEDGRKLAGILCEGSFKGAEPESFVAGIGINVNQNIEDFSDEVASRATSLREHALDELEVITRVVAGLEQWWERWDVKQVLERFRELADGETGRAIRVQPRDGEGFEAVTGGIADDGGLIVEIEDGTRRVLYAEDVLYLR